MSLFAKILLWFWISLLVLAGFFMVMISLQFQLPLMPQFAFASSGKLQLIERQIAIELSDSPRYSWDNILKEFGNLHGVSFVLTSVEGQRMAGFPQQLPEEIRFLLTKQFHLQPPPATNNDLPPEDEFAPPPPPPGAMFPKTSGSIRPPRRAGGENAPEANRALKGGFLFEYTQKPSLYWFGLRTLIWIDRGHPIHAILLASSDSMTGNGLFFDLHPWLPLLLLCLLLAILMWLPFARRLTRRISRMMTAAETIGKGHFDVEVKEKGSDELARLAQAINVMAQKLNGYVHGQKRFLGDIAHELGSPVARIQLGLGILENRTSGEDRQRVSDVLEEVDELSALVNELLEFTRADLKRKQLELVKVSLSEVVQRAMAREATGKTVIRCDVEEELSVLGNMDLLVRAVSNLLRNAIRYAGEESPIHIVAKRQHDRILLRVRDHGPGVAEKEVPHLFEPFYRVESSRSRETGGTGLGLAIVATCMDACRGEVEAANHPEGGLEVTLEFPA